MSSNFTQVTFSTSGTTRQSGGLKFQLSFFWDTLVYIVCICTSKKVSWIHKHCNEGNVVQNMNISRSYLILEYSPVYYHVFQLISWLYPELSGAPLRKSGAGAGAPLLFHTWSGSGSAAPFLGGAVGNLALRAPAPVKFQIIDILYLFFSNNL